MIAEILSLRGAQVIATGTAREALESIRKCPPDALITDISMPGEDGYALIRAVRALSPEEGGLIPAVALTAHASQAVRSRLLSAGFQMHLAKPVDLMELPSQLNDLVRKTPAGE
jgi:CheY-like chemotaxis protein